MASIIKGRYWVAAGMFLLSLLLYIDRVCISVAKDPIAGDLNLSDKAMGWILSSFALGYALMQVPSGWSADRFGPRKILGSIVSFWSSAYGINRYCLEFHFSNFHSLSIWYGRSRGFSGNVEGYLFLDSPERTWICTWPELFRFHALAPLLPCHWWLG